MTIKSMKSDSGVIHQKRKMKPYLNVEIEDKTETVRNVEVVKADDVKVSPVSFGKYSSPKNDENPSLRPFVVQTNQENNRSSLSACSTQAGIFRRFFGNEQKQEHNRDPEVENRKLEIEEKANQIIEAAKKQAAEIKEKAREEGYKEGYQEGYNSGVETGKNEALESVHEETDYLIELLSSSLKEISTLNDTILKEMESNTLKLSMIIAKKLACRELSMHTSAIVDVVKTALELVEDGKRIVVKVNPLDLETVREYRPDILRLIKATDIDETLENNDVSNIDVNLVIEEDEAISRGGCVIETESQSLDATFETRLDEIVEAILRIDD